MDCIKIIEGAEMVLASILFCFPDLANYCRN